MVKPPDHLSRGDSQQGTDQPVNLRQQEDFTLEEMRKREQAAEYEAGEVYRKTLAYTERIRRGEAKAPRPEFEGDAKPLTSAALDLELLKEKSRKYIERNYPKREGDFTYDKTSSLSYADQRLADATNAFNQFRQERRSRTTRELTSFPQLEELRSELEEVYNIEITDDDVNNLALWGQVQNAAREYVRYLNNGDINKAQNIALTITDPRYANSDDFMQGVVTASLFGALVEESFKDYVTEGVKDPDWVDETLEWFGDKASTVFNWIAAPGRKQIREATAAAYMQTEGEPETGLMGTLRRYGLGSIAGGLENAILDPEGFKEAKAATEPGKFNENYIAQLVGNPSEGLWTQLEVDLAKDVVRRRAIGEEDPVAKAWAERQDRNTEEVASFFTSLQFSFGPDADRINSLIRQVQSVELSNYAGVMMGSSSADLQFDPKRGSEFYSTNMGMSDFMFRLISDPINIIPIPLRAGLAAKWNLAKLRPGATDAIGNPLRAVDVLKKRNLVGVNINTPVSRYFDRFAKDLNKLNDLEAAVTNAATKEAADAAKLKATRFRQKMSEDYDAMPDQLIESFRTNPAHKRNADGVFDLETVAQYIDDTNDAYLALTGKINSKIAEGQVIDVADQVAVETFLSQRPLFAEAVASTTLTRSLMIPRRGPLGILRRNMLNSIILDAAPKGTAARVLDNSFDPSMTTAQIANAMDKEFIQIGKEIAKDRGGIGRWIRSIPTGLSISLDNASGSKEFYKWATQFMDKNTAAFLTDAFRVGDAGSRRLLLGATFRTAMASRGVPLTRGQVDDWLTRTTGAPTKAGDGQVSGSMSGEAYSAAMEDGVRPTEKLAKFREAKRATSRSTIPGVQEPLIPGAGSAAAQVAPIEQFGVIPRVRGEDGQLQLSKTIDEFIDDSEEFTRAYDDAVRLFDDPNASPSDQRLAYEKADEIESSLRATYAREQELLEIQQQIAAMPRFRVLDDGTREPVFPGHDEAIIERRAREELDALELPDPVASDFENASGVYMTPRERELYENYGFLTEAYIRRAYKNLLGDTEAGRRLVAPKLTAKELENTPPNDLNVGGIEVFNYLLKRPSQADEAVDNMYLELGASDRVDTNFGFGEIELGLTPFNPTRSGVAKTGPKRKLRPALTISEAKAIRDGEYTFEEVTRIIKTEGRSLTPEQAKLVRDRYGINVRASARRTTKQPMGYYVEWAENSTEIGRARLLEEIKESLRLADEGMYEDIARGELAALEILEKRRDALNTVIKSGGKDLPDDIDSTTQLIADDFNADIAARADGRKPISANDTDPIIKVVDDIDESLRSMRWSPSRDANGMEHAIHQYQIARSMRLPSIQDIDDLAAIKNQGARMYGKLNKAWGEVVDAWSFATLFGPRFSMRNAIEELIFYVLTGGRIGDLYAGRRASTAMRTARPRFVYEEIVDEAGNTSLELVIKTNLGLFNRLSRGYTLSGKLRDEMNQEWLAAITIPNTTKDDFIRAQIAWQAGDSSAYVNLFAKALIRERSNLPTNISARQEEALHWIAGSQHGLKLVQNVAEGGNSLLNGRLPSNMQDVIRMTDADPSEIDALLKSYPNYNPGLSPGEFAALKPVKYDPSTGEQINGVWYWWRELQAIVHGDGPIGKLAVRYIGDPDTAKRAIADYIRQDSKWGYKETWSMFSPGQDIDEAAARYYENVLNNFQKPNGEINWKLRNMFVDRVDGQDIVGWYKPRKPGVTPFDDFSKAEKTHRVSVQQLSSIPVDSRPSVIFGRRYGQPEPVPVLTGWQGIITKGYGIVGRQNARISREPIFYANFLNMIDQLGPGDEAMAQAMAKAAGRDAPNELDRAVAAEWTNRTAADSAYAMTLAYVDNPANRSLLAWRVRNVARYYRATEDFYRRARRLAITRPEAYYRAALTYSLLDQTGFVYTDDNGEKYFYYPGNEYVQKAITTFAGFLQPEMKPFFWEDVSPFQLGGRVLGTTPSADPRMALPTAVGPGTFPFAFAFDFFPPLKEMSGLRNLVIGPYVEKQSSVVDLLINTFTPAGIARLQQLTEDEVDSITQEAAYDTIKIFIAEGLLDAEDLAVEGGVIGIESFLNSDVWKQASTVATGLAATKFMLSILGPAAPQIYEARQINPAARDLGISSFDTVWRQLLDLNKDEPDPWNATASMYYAAKVRKAAGLPTEYDPWNNLTPFTVSGSKANPEKLGSLSGVRATDEFLKWTMSDEYKNLEKLPGGPESVMWLAPPDGEFDWQAWQIVTNVTGLQVPKSIEEKLMSLFAATGQFQDTQIRKSYDELIAILDPRDPEQKKAIDALNRKKIDERNLNERRNPYWGMQRSDQGSAYAPTRLAESVKQMEIFIRSVRESDYEVPEALEYIDSAIEIYRKYKLQIDGLGQKNVEKQVKIQLLYELNTKLQQIAGGNEQAKKFIDTVLDTLNYGELTQLDPLIVEEVAE